MRPPIERIQDRRIKTTLPKPSDRAFSLRAVLTKYQIENLLDIYPYLHGASHGYGQQGPARRRLQDLGIIKARDDGWILTRLGYEIVAILVLEKEEAEAESNEIKQIINEVSHLARTRDWSRLSGIIARSRTKEKAIKFLKGLALNVEYRDDPSHQSGGRFSLPREIKLSSDYEFLLLKSKQGAKFSYSK